jgi:hypothetical protein
MAGFSTSVRASERRRPLAARLFPKDHAQVAPGTVVEYPRLDGVLTWIAAQQRERDQARLADPKLNGREKQRLRAGQPLRTPAAPPK